MENAFEFDPTRDYLAEWELEAEKKTLVPKGKNGRPLCLAKCRDGNPCQAQVAIDPVTNRPRNQRCRMHGGASTGPKTSAGKRRIGEAVAQRNRERAAKRRTERQ